MSGIVEKLHWRAHPQNVWTACGRKAADPGALGVAASSSAEYVTKLAALRPKQVRKTCARAAKKAQGDGR